MRKDFVVVDEAGFHCGTEPHVKKAVVCLFLSLLVYLLFAGCYFYCIDKCPDVNTALPEYAFGVGFTFWPYMFGCLLVMSTGGNLAKQLYLWRQQSKN